MIRLRLNSLLPLLTLSAGLAATYFLQQAVETSAQRVLQEDFDSQASEIALRIDQRMNAYRQVLRGTKGLFAASKSVERDEFREYISSQRLAEHYPGVQGVGFSLIVQPQEKAKHIKAIRKEGFTNYTIRPDGERNLYTSIIYLEPFADRNLRAFGFDMYSEAVRRAAMELARDTDKSTISGKVKLVQENNEKVQAGFLMYVPVYRNGSAHATIDERRASIVGWAYSPFRMNDLMQGILGDRLNKVDLEIYDGKTATPETLMFDSSFSHGNKSNAHPLFNSEIQSEIINHDWLIKIHSQPGFAENIGTAQITTIRLSGILLSLALAGMFFILIGRREQALKLAREMTSELNERKEELSKAQLQAGLGSWSVIFGADESHDVWSISKELRTLYGHSDDLQVAASTGYELMPPEDQALTRGYWSAAKEGKGPAEWDHRVVINGETKWMHVKADFTFDAGGKALSANGTSQDITESKLAERALQQSEEALRRSEQEMAASQRIGGTGSWVYDMAKNKIHVSDNSLALFGFPPGVNDYPLDDFLKCIPDRDRVGQCLAEAIREERQYDDEYVLNPANGSPSKIIHSIGWLEKDAHGRPARVVGFIQDITERKNSERVLSESEERFRTMANSAPVLIWIAGTDKLCFWFNDVWLKFTGRTIDQETGNGWAEGVHPDDFQRCLDIYISNFDLRHEFRMEYRLKRHDGEYRWIHDNGVPRFDSDNNFVGYIGSCVDVTDQRLALEKLKTSEKNYQAIFKNSPDAYLIMELDGGKIADCNLAAERMLKGSSAEIIGKTPDLISPPNQPDGRTSLESVPEKIERALADGYNSFEWVHRRLNGEDFWAEVTISVIDYLNRKVLMVAWRDVSERKQLALILQAQQNELINTNEKLQLLNSLVEDSSDPFYVLDVNDDFRMILTNKASSRHYGLPKEKLLAMRVPDWDPDVGSEQLQKLLAAVKENGHLIIETRHRHSSGELIPVEVSVNYFHHENIEYLYGFIVDIRNRREMEKALLHAKESAESLSRSKSEFLANMSHEIRTPMNAIIGLSNLALNKEMTDEVRDYLAKINSSSESLLGILNDILDFSKMEAGKLGIENRSFNLADMLDDLDDLFSTRIQDKNLGFTVKIDSDIPKILVGDSMRIQQILSNLLGNAIKFTSQGKVDIQVQLLEQENSNVKVLFSVSDTGIGISAEDQTKLFQPFSQADTSITRRFGGTGLGLAISHRLLQLMGSNFQIDSEEGMGSTFSFELLLGVASGELSQKVERRHIERKAGTLSADLRQRGEALSGRRILVAEDSIVNQQVVKEFLKLSGVNVGIANNGKEALSQLEQNSYDAILMDIHMPEMGGVEATEHIRRYAKYAALPIIALTAGVTQEEREKCKACGMNDFIAKPINPEELLSVLCHWVGKNGVDLASSSAKVPMEKSALAAAEQTMLTLAGFDFNNLLEMVGGDEKIVKELLLGFRNEMDSIEAEIEAHIKENRLQETGELMHRIKGTAGNLGATELNRIAATIEASLKRNELDRVMYEHFKHVFRQTKSELDNLNG